MRGSDPDAAVYWMARMLEAGEDPLFVLRRMVIFAAEDVGNADPRALLVAVAALDAFRFVGLPEGMLPMTQAALYLATAPKTNTALTTYAAAKARRRRARRAARARRTCATPPRKLTKELGYGAGYQYPHDFEGHYVARGVPARRAPRPPLLRAVRLRPGTRHRRTPGAAAGRRPGQGKAKALAPPAAPAASASRV